MSRHCHRLATAAAVVAAFAVAWAPPAQGAEPATELTIDATNERSYEIPEEFPLQGRLVESTASGRTMIANTVGKGEEAACTIVVATGESAEAFPYRHSSEGTRCVGVLPDPDGGFFVRGMRAGANRGEVAGITARLGADGDEKWLVHDTKTAESDDFKGSYQQPHSPLAYSPQSDYLLTFTTGLLTIGEIDEKTVTHASVIRGGEMRVPAKTLGEDGGFGVIGGVATLESSGNFLLYIYSPGSQGATFFTYNGRESVDAFEPLGEDWSERFVRRMIYGPDSNVYLLWSDDPESDGPTHLSVVDDEAAEVWTGSYASTVVLPADRNAPPPDVGDAGGDVDEGAPETKEVTLGAPGAIWVGSEHVVILYAANDPYLRVVDAQTGEEVGVAPLAGATQMTPINILKGEDGKLKLLAVDDEMTRFHELSLEFEIGERPDVDTSPGDAGFSDVADGGGDAGEETGCSTTGGSPPFRPLGALWVIAAFGVAAVGRSF